MSPLCEAAETPAGPQNHQKRKLDLLSPVEPTLPMVVPQGGMGEQLCLIRIIFLWCPGIEMVPEEGVNVDREEQRCSLGRCKSLIAHWRSHWNQSLPGYCGGWLPPGHVATGTASALEVDGSTRNSLSDPPPSEQTLELLDLYLCVPPSPVKKIYSGLSP